MLVSVGPKPKICIVSYMVQDLFRILSVNTNHSLIITNPLILLIFKISRP